MREFFKHMLLLTIFFVFNSACSQSQSLSILPAAEDGEKYLPQLKGKKVALITNHSARVNEIHLVDYLLKNDIELLKIFAPEHGFRGDRSDGAHIVDEVDPKTGLPVFSLHGKNKKPRQDMLEGVDVLLFDIQDVGLRFYTYTSTLGLAMEAASEAGVSFMVLDRPNPNSYYIDGPVLDMKYASFVGAYPIPVVYGMTMGELALMIKGEKWIDYSETLKLEIIKIQNYTHDSLYQLPLAPSPNLPNMQSVYLYSSLCLFEGANVSIGRGTTKPFQLIGYPGFQKGSYQFTPVSIPGASKYPKFENQECSGYDLSGMDQELIVSQKKIQWNYLWEMYAELGEEDFFKSLDYFQKLSGSDKLHQALKSKKTIDEFCESYQDELHAFQKKREKYLLYP